MRFSNYLNHNYFPIPLLFQNTAVEHYHVRHVRAGWEESLPRQQFYAQLTLASHLLLAHQILLLHYMTELLRSDPTVIHQLRHLKQVHLISLLQERTTDCEVTNLFHLESLIID